MADKIGLIMVHLLNTTSVKRFPDRYIFISTCSMRQVGNLVRVARDKWLLTERIFDNEGSWSGVWYFPGVKEATDSIIRSSGPVLHHDALTYAQARAARLSI